MLLCCTSFVCTSTCIFSLNTWNLYLTGFSLHSRKFSVRRKLKNFSLATAFESDHDWSNSKVQLFNSSNNDKRGQTFVTIVTHICNGLYRQQFLQYLEGNSSFSIEIRYSITSDWMDMLLRLISVARTLYTFAFSSSGLSPTCSTSLSNKYSW